MNERKKTVDIVTTYSRNKSVWIRSRGQIDRHDIGGVSVEALKKLARFDIPKGTCGITRTSQHLKQFNATIAITTEV